MQGQRQTSLSFPVSGHQGAMGQHGRADQEDKRLLKHPGLHLGYHGNSIQTAYNLLNIFKSNKLLINKHTLSVRCISGQW